jgi:putative membrane protein
MREGRTGLDVDARFLLANERTLLAWVRTSLTLLAAGVAVEHLAPELVGRTALAVMLLIAGLATVIAGGVRFRSADRAIRDGRLPTNGFAPYALVAVVAVTAIVAAVVVLAS